VRVVHHEVTHVHVVVLCLRARGAIPKRYTCDDANVSPPLAWSGAPAGTKSFALIVDDPDAPDPAAPKRVYVHWVLYDIPATVAELTEGEGRASNVSGAHDGLNDDKGRGYTGPLSAHRPSPILSQAVRAGRIARRSRRRSAQGRRRASDGGTRAGDGRADGNVFALSDVPRSRS
jgi:Raf kinase inhibitor-like YbhB/YbcL family protein